LRLAQACLADQFAIRHSTLELDRGGKCGEADHHV